MSQAGESCGRCFFLAWAEKEGRGGWPSVSSPGRNADKPQGPESTMVVGSQISAARPPPPPPSPLAFL